MTERRVIKLKKSITVNGEVVNELRIPLEPTIGMFEKLPDDMWDSTDEEGNFKPRPRDFPHLVAAMCDIEVSEARQIGVRDLDTFEGAFTDFFAAFLGETGEDTPGT